MVFERIKYYHYFLFSAVFFSVGFLVWYLTIHVQETNGHESYRLYIENKISEEVAISDNELIRVENQFRESGNNLAPFLKMKLKYPIYVFEKGELVYWSNNKYVPNYSGLSGYTEKINFAQLPIGKFLIIKKRYGKNWDAYSFIPLSEEYSITNNYIKSGLNEDIFTHENIEINNFHTKNEYAIHSENGIYLFSIYFLTAKTILDNDYLYSAVFLFALSIISLIIGLFYLVNKLLSSGKILHSSLILALSLATVRVIMLYFSFPYFLVSFDLFNSKYFASSEISPSLGDLFINILFFSFFSWFILLNYSKSTMIKTFIKKAGRFSFWIGIFLSATSLVILLYLSYIFSEIYSNSQFLLDITQNIDVNLFKAVSLVVIFLASGIYFIYNHIALRLYIIVSQKKTGFVRFMPILLVSSLSEIAVYFMGIENWILIPVNLIYWVILIYFSLPKNIGTLRYSTYLYFLLTAFICSFTGAINLYYVNAEKNIIEKNKYAFQLLNENDLVAEYLLNEGVSLIEKDKFITMRFKSIFLTKDVIAQKIKKVLLPKYLEKYEAHVSVFDREGNVIIQSAEYSNYYDAYQKYAKDSFQTEYKQIYFLHEKNNNPLKRYMAFKEVYEDNVLIGSIIIELVHKKNSPHSVYPELLVDKKFISPKQYNTYQYAIYHYGVFDSKLLLSKGIYNYDKYFNEESLKNPELYQDGIVINGYHHLGVRSSDEKVIIITSEKYTVGNILSNFSFLFFLLLILVLFFVAGYIYYFQFRKLHLNYATKILVYLNVAFFLPLVIVSIITLSLISNYYKTSQSKSFVKKAEGLSINILNHLENYQDDLNWETRLESDIAQLASYTDSDINLFDEKGELLYSYHPAIYDRNLLSRKINVEAYVGIVQVGATEIMLNESLGKLNYNTVYMPIKSYKTGSLLGILSIPFFESREELNQQLIGIFTTTLNIFSIIFIVFAGLSYFASRILTSPLNIITQKIKKTTFGENVPLDWDSKDEIGLLISEYNSMLLKLEENRMVLSKSEKESAWREMAKQVAHEIKNPLTPMKLKIQHLQRSWAQKNENVVSQTEEGLQSLLNQVNILSEIASSFSAFAKMPIPKHEHFDIAEVLKSTINLYNNTHDIFVDSKISEGNFVVEGDEQLMGAIFTNLIINAIQAVSSNADPKVELTLYQQGKAVIIAVKDNGIGIHPSFIDSVFLPNFSTKENGSGIGLAVAKRGIEHAGGRIWLDTKLGVGTTFYIEIPLVI